MDSPTVAVLDKAPLRSEIWVRSTMEIDESLWIACLLVVSSVEVEADDGPLVVTGEVQGSARLLVGDEVGVS